MRLLILTQKVDKSDPVLGFFHRWLEEFAKHCESIIVICLEKGEHSLPEHVKILSLGKEERMSRLRYVLNFYKYIWGERKNYDKVFVHMNPEYLVLGGLFWKVWRKRMGLWYVHRQTNFKLWLAEKFVHIIFSSAPESFRLKSRKISYVGHGIDVDHFRFSVKDFNQTMSLVHVGRITRIKNLEVIIRAAEGYSLCFVGGPITADDVKYQEELKVLASDIGIEVEWAGFVSHMDMPKVYSKFSASINAAPNGGMDKSVLESWASGCPAFASNKAFDAVFGEHKNMFQFNSMDAQDLTSKIAAFAKYERKEDIVREVSDRVRREYGVEKLVIKILTV